MVPNSRYVPNCKTVNFICKNVLNTGQTFYSCKISFCSNAPHSLVQYIEYLCNKNNNNNSSSTPPPAVPTGGWTYVLHLLPPVYNSHRWADTHQYNGGIVAVAAIIAGKPRTQPPPRIQYQWFPA